MCFQCFCSSLAPLGYWCRNELIGSLHLPHSNCVIFLCWSALYQCSVCEPTTSTFHMCSRIINVRLTVIQVLQPCGTWNTEYGLRCHIILGLEASSLLTRSRALAYDCTVCQAEVLPISAPCPVCCTCMAICLEELRAVLCSPAAQS